MAPPVQTLRPAHRAGLGNANRPTTRPHSTPTELGSSGQLLRRLYKVRRLRVTWSDVMQDSRTSKLCPMSYVGSVKNLTLLRGSIERLAVAALTAAGNSSEINFQWRAVDVERRRPRESQPSSTERRGRTRGEGGTAGSGVKGKDERGREFAVITEHVQ